MDSPTLPTTPLFFGMRPLGTTSKRGQGQPGQCDQTQRVRMENKAAGVMGQGGELGHQSEGRGFYSTS